MKHFKSLITILLCSFSLYAVDNATTPLENNTYVDSMPDNSSCMFTCPTMKEGYFARIHDILPSKGETQCFIYQNTDPSTVLGYVTYTNDTCKKANNLTESEEYQVNANGTDDEFGLDEITQKYNEHYTNVGANKNYLRTSKYLLAGLTADNEIIDIPSTLTKNKLTVNSGYTIYPNASSKLPDDSLLQSVVDTLGGWWSGAVTTITGEEVAKAQYKGYENELSSVNEMAFSSVVAMMLNWLADSNNVLLDMNSTLFFVIFPLTAGLFFLGKATKALGDKQDNEDNFEKGFLALLTLWVFYFSSGELDLDNNRKITYTNFQTWSRPVLYEGVEFADQLTLAFTKAYITYKAKDAGLFYQKDYKQIHDESARLTKENALLENSGNGMLGLCYQVYDTDRLHTLAGEAVGANTVFPPLGSLNKDRKGKPDANGKDTNVGISNLEETAFLKPEYRRSDNVPTLEACYNFERRFLENDKIIESNKQLQQQYEKAMGGSQAKEGIKLVAELMFKNTADMGFINVSNIASTNVLLENLDLFLNAEIKEKSNEKTVELENQVTSQYATSNIVSSDMPWYSGARWIMLNSAYMMVPPASTIKKDIVEPFLSAGVDIVKNLSSKVSIFSSVATFGISDLIQIMLKKLDNKKDLKDVAIEASISFLALILTILFMKMFLSYMPLVAISVAGYLAIGFYYISVEIFYLVAPFIAIYALSTEQGNVLKSFISRFIALSFKPILIVLSVVMAMMASDIFNSLAQIGAHKTFDSFFALTNFERTHFDETLTAWQSTKHFFAWAGDFKDYGLLFFKGILIVSAKVVSLLVVFYLVFYGSTMILNIFGMKDSGVDAQETVGNTLEGKASKYGTAM